MNQPINPVSDALGRPLHDLRISVTDRCNLRCTYCMPADCFRDDHAFLPKSELLAFDEIEMIARAAAELGVRKLRITGGEPLLRKDLAVLVAALADISGVDDIAMTTNGVLLDGHAAALRKAGLHRLTVSLDSLDDSVLQSMNGTSSGAAPVLRGIAAAIEAGFPPPKINIVVQRGVNDGSLLDLVRHFRGTGCTLRFIEFMDVGTLNEWKLNLVVPASEIRDQIHRAFPLRPLSQAYAGEVAQRYGFEDGMGEIGLIASVTQPFCGDCSRLRLSSDGKLFTCLFAGNGVDLKSKLRGEAEEGTLREWLREIWQDRTDRYSESRSRLFASPRIPKVEMYRVGG